MAIIVEGRVDEASESGRYCFCPGDYFIHQEFEAHADSVGANGAMIVNVDLPADFPEVPKSGVIDPEKFCSALAATGIGEAMKWAAAVAAPTGNRRNDWPDLLAAEIVAGGAASVAEWAHRHGLAVETVSRGFRRAYGLSPKLFRAIVRARRAATATRLTAKPFAALAQEFGYCDQSHFSRAVHSVTGASPGVWRKSNGYNRG